MSQREKDAKRKRERYWALKEQGLCIKDCGRDAVSGHVRCSLCMRKNQYYSKQHYLANSEIYKKRTKERQDKRRELGLCTHCGCELLEDENIKCSNCSQGISRRGYAIHYKATSKRS